MAGSSSKASPRFKKAVRKFTEIDGLTLVDAMKISNFTTDEINDRTLKQRIRRAAAKAGDGQNPSYSNVD
jgi:hypothetical protein